MRVCVCIRIIGYQCDPMRYNQSVWVYGMERQQNPN